MTMTAGGNTVTERTDGAPQCGGDVDAQNFGHTPTTHCGGGLFPLNTMVWVGSKKVFARVEFWPWYDFYVRI
jgi:hypothetical protein